MMGAWTGVKEEVGGGRKESQMYGDEDFPFLENEDLK